MESIHREDDDSYLIYIEVFLFLFLEKTLTLVIRESPDWIASIRYLYSPAWTVNPCGIRLRHCRWWGPAFLGDVENMTSQKCILLHPWSHESMVSWYLMNISMLGNYCCACCRQEYLRLHHRNDPVQLADIVPWPCDLQQQQKPGLKKWCFGCFLWVETLVDAFFPLEG